MDKPPTYFVKEGDDIVEKEAPIIEKKCWWCHNPFMYRIPRQGVFLPDLVYYQCVSCKAKEDMNGINFRSGIGERKDG